MQNNDNAPSWRDALGAVEAAFLDAIAAAERQLQQDAPSRDIGTEKCCMSDYLSQELVRHVPGARFSSHSTGGKRKVIVPGVAVLRAKAVNRDLIAQNYPTAGHQDWLNGCLPGLPPLPYVDVGYEIDPQSREVTRAHLIERDSDGQARWYVELPVHGHAREEVVALPLPGLVPDIALTAEAARLIAKRRNLAGDSSAG